MKSEKPLTRKDVMDAVWRLVHAAEDVGQDRAGLKDGHARSPVVAAEFVAAEKDLKRILKHLFYKRS